MEEQREPAAHLAQCFTVTDEDIDMIPDRIASDEEKVFLKARKDKLSIRVTQVLLYFFKSALNSEAQCMLDIIDSNGRSRR